MSRRHIGSFKGVDGEDILLLWRAAGTGWFCTSAVAGGADTDGFFG
jgi:hypothetical protein